MNCVNLDCDHADRVLEAARDSGKPVITFSQQDQEADVYAAQVRKQGGDILFRVRTRRFQREFRLTMPGLFNVENALAAIAVCQALDIPEECVYVGLMKARVPGRMEVYTNADDTVMAIVDYAHNRMSFETLFRSVQEEYPGRRIVTVFGCPGKKALDRRQDLGEAAGVTPTWWSSPRRTAGRRTPWTSAGRSPGMWPRQGLRVLHRAQPGGGHPPGHPGLPGPALGAADHRQGGGDPPEAGPGVYRHALRRGLRPGLLAGVRRAPRPGRDGEGAQPAVRPARPQAPRRARRWW